MEACAVEQKILLFGSINPEKTNLLRLIEGGTADGDFGLSDVTMNEISENLTVSSLDDFVERFLPDRCLGLFWQLAKMMDDRRQERYGMTDAAELYGAMLPGNRGQKQECVKIRNQLMKHASLDENVLLFRYLQQMADTESGARMMTEQLLGDICNGLQMSDCNVDRSLRADIPGVPVRILGRSAQPEEQLITWTRRRGNSTGRCWMRMPMRRMAAVKTGSLCWNGCQYRFISRTGMKKG